MTNYKKGSKQAVPGGFPGFHGSRGGGGAIAAGYGKGGNIKVAKFAEGGAVEKDDYATADTFDGGKVLYNRNSDRFKKEQAHVEKRADTTRFTPEQKERVAANTTAGIAALDARIEAAGQRAAEKAKAKQ